MAERPETTGLVADIQRFSLHDGPGIRTSVFLKGCNMRCAWCHNPETISFEPQVIVDPDKCVGCGQCAKGCYSGARRQVGRMMRVEDVLDEVLQDAPYYGDTGGMTLTGGEPGCQIDFSRALLDAAGKKGVRRAVETNMSLPWETQRQMLERCETIMCDLKLWDGEKHRRWTGVDNGRVKDNILRADALGREMLVRTPLVDGVNADAQEIGAIARFLSPLKNLAAYELLPYHPLGLSKRIEGVAPQARFAAPERAQVMRLARLAAGFGVRVRVAGVEIGKEE